jgi:cysteine desulfurase
MIYIDNASTTRPKPEVIAAITQCLTETWGNPSSLHSLGHDAKLIMEDSRKTVAEFIGANPSEIIFTSGACEANSLAICGYLKNNNYKLITTSIEHKSIMNIANDYKDRTVVVSVDKFGFVNMEELEIALKGLPRLINKKNSHLVSIQYANNEIGTIQNIEQISSLVHSYGCVLHTDATQIIPDRKINVKHVDMMSFSGQKFGAPKGIGVLYVKNKIHITPIIYGSQEKSLRGGTENVPYIAGIAAAIKSIVYPTSELRDYFTKSVLSSIDGCHIVGCESGESRLSNNASISFDGVNSETVLLMLSAKGIYASSGSACNSNMASGSYVLKAIGENADSVIRFTFDNNTKDEIDIIIKELINVVNLLRR